MNSLDWNVRLLLRAAMALFAVTIVIGILNGMDLWDPPHNLLMTHVHAGTLGWITLAVVGAAMWLFGADGGAGVRVAQRIAIAAVVTTVVYVTAFATTGGVFRPIAGTLMLLAIIWVLIWVVGRYPTSDRSTAQLGILLATISLTIGAVLGVLLGLFLARGSVPGLSNETARALAGAHPPSMLIGYLILSGAALVHWLLGGAQTRSGRLVMWALFAAGVLANLAFILDIEPLIQVSTLLEVVAVVTLVVHLRGQLAPSAWRQGDADNFARVAVIFLVVGIALLVNVVRLFISGELNPETGEGPIGWLLAFDHAMFIGVMTNALFAMVMRVAAAKADTVLLWGANTGLALFLVGLAADVAVLKQVGAPVMGLVLLYGLVRFFTQLRPQAQPATS